VDAIGVGSGTVLADDPLLTVRDCYRSRLLVRVIFDRSLRVSPQARLFSTLTAGPVIIMTTAAAASRHAGRANELTRAGATILEVPGDIRQDLRELLQFDVSTLLLEGGSSIHAAAWRAGVVDRVHVITAPITLGEAGVKSFGGMELPVSELIPIKVDQLGPDQWMEADVHGHS
jgi:diaminohydroxyphosphoribosylaminopyrimidine deaminase/5-amino-6-(5-phosphoribosylamino)uracil reductase